MQYFPSCAYLGNAKIGLNKDAGLRLEITLKNTSVILDDFYIYYDQNEEMQNYLIEWNLNARAPGGRGEGDYAEEPQSGGYGERESESVRLERRGAQVRAETDEAVRYGRIAQAYNRGEAKVSFIWNVMSALCLGFVVCVMAYGIISVNNYHKMKSMQDTIDYCLALVTESLKQNEAVLTNAAAIATALNGEDKQPADQISGSSGEGADLAADDSSKLAEDQPIDTNVSLEYTQPTTDTAVQDAVGDVPAQHEGAVGQTKETSEQAQVSTGQNEEASGQAQVSTGQNEEASEQAKKTVAENVGDTAEPTDSAQNTEMGSTPQYYVVRRGDTLRSICFQVYGDYSKVDEVCEWNKIEDPNSILYGQRLLLP